MQGGMHQNISTTAIQSIQKLNSALKTSRFLFNLNESEKEFHIRYLTFFRTYYHVPPTEKDDCPIVYHKIMNPKASTYFFDNALKTYCMTMGNIKAMNSVNLIP